MNLGVEFYLATALVMAAGVLSVVFIARARIGSTVLKPIRRVRRQETPVVKSFPVRSFDGKSSGK